MNFVICKIGSTKKGLVTFTLERNNVIVVFKKLLIYSLQHSSPHHPARL